ncbi:hypothetical protein ACFYMO_30725 [Streptomyces sp. NPDC007025]|uniref:hypothetical protein n=1 Tax=Streptomyces sp. NPDC007025 TaxID=3364771 RepID=UPI0036A0B958
MSSDVRGRDRTGELELRYRRRLSAYIAARLGASRYRQAEAVSDQVWEVVRASPGLIKASTDREASTDGEEFGALAHVVRQVMVRRHLAARRLAPQPVASPARLLTTTRLGVAA